MKERAPRIFKDKSGKPYIIIKGKKKYIKTNLGDTELVKLVLKMLRKKRKPRPNKRRVRINRPQQQMFPIIPISGAAGTNPYQNTPQQITKDDLEKLKDLITGRRPLPALPAPEIPVIPAGPRFEEFEEFDVGGLTVPIPSGIAGQFQERVTIAKKTEAQLEKERQKANELQKQLDKQRKEAQQQLNKIEIQRREAEIEIANEREKQRREKENGMIENRIKAFKKLASTVADAEITKIANANGIKTTKGRQGKRSRQQIIIPLPEGEQPGRVGGQGLQVGRDLR